MADKLQANGFAVAVDIAVTDVDDAFNEVSCRLFCEGKVLETLADRHYNGHGQAFDSMTLSDETTEFFKKNYAEMQSDATRQGVSLDLLIERQQLTKMMLDALHNHWINSKKGGE